MKVIKKGRPQKGWAKQITCTGKGNGRGGCGAVLMVEEDDLFHTYRSIMGRDEEWYVTFKCSECGVLSDVNGWPGNARDLPHYTDWKAKHAPEPERSVIVSPPDGPTRADPCCAYAIGMEGGHMCDDCYYGRYGKYR